MSRMSFALWPACVKSHGFREQLAAARKAGFDTLPIGPLTYQSLCREGLTGSGIRGMAADQGIALGHFDGFAAWAPYDLAPGTPEAARAVFSLTADDCLRICDALELPAICCTGVYDPQAAELPRVIEGLAAFSERAARHGLQVDLEFIPMWAIPDLATAWQIVSETGCSNAAVMVDSWHFFRGRPDLELLEAMPPGSIRTVQLADAPLKAADPDLFAECLRFRRVPGEGDLPLERFVDILARKGGITSIGPEVFADELDGVTAAVAAGRVADACRTLLAGTPLAPVSGAAELRPLPGARTTNQPQPAEINRRSSP